MLGPSTCTPPRCANMDDVRRLSAACKMNGLDGCVVRAAAWVKVRHTVLMVNLGGGTWLYAGGGTRCSCFLVREHKGCLVTDSC
jgi:hypothetical protein